MRRALLALPLLAAAALGHQTSSIRGTVRDATTAEPIQGMMLSVSPQPTGTSQRAETGADGTYSVSGLAAGVYNVTLVGTADRNRITRTARLAAGAELSRFDFESTRSRRASVSGVVLDEEGKPVPGLLIRLLSQRYAFGFLTYPVMASA